MLTGPPPKFHGARDILGSRRGHTVSTTGQTSVYLIRRRQSPRSSPCSTGHEAANRLKSDASAGTGVQGLRWLASPFSPVRSPAMRWPGFGPTTARKLLRPTPRKSGSLHLEVRRTDERSCRSSGSDDAPAGLLDNYSTKTTDSERSGLPGMGRGSCGPGVEQSRSPCGVRLAILGECDQPRAAQRRRSTTSCLTTSLDAWSHTRRYAGWWRSAA